jgi:hypothetical protein
MAQNGNVDSLEDTKPETPELTENTSEENADKVAE